MELHIFLNTYEIITICVTIVLITYFKNRK